MNKGSEFKSHTERGINFGAICELVVELPGNQDVCASPGGGSALLKEKLLCGQKRHEFALYSRQTVDRSGQGRTGDPSKEGSGRLSLDSKFWR